MFLDNPVLVRLDIYELLTLFQTPDISFHFDLEIIKQKTFFFLISSRDLIIELKQPDPALLSPHIIVAEKNSHNRSV